MAYSNPFWKGIYNLLIGLGVTIRYLFSHAITLQYPTERWPMPERSRGQVVLLSDKETGKLNCTACTLCAKACPTAAISMDRYKGEDKKWKLSKFDVDFTICCYCGFCEEACNFDAIKLAPKYEYSSYDKESLFYDMHKLQEVGRDVDYTPKRPKKKAAPTPAVDAEKTEGDVKTDSEQPPTQPESPNDKPTKPEGDK